MFLFLDGLETESSSSVAVQKFSDSSELPMERKNDRDFMVRQQIDGRRASMGCKLI